MFHAIIILRITRDFKYIFNYQMYFLRGKYNYYYYADNLSALIETFNYFATVSNLLI